MVPEFFAGLHCAELRESMESPRLGLLSDWLRQVAPEFWCVISPPCRFHISANFGIRGGRFLGYDPRSIGWPVSMVCHDPVDPITINCRAQSQSR
jgi:hypothetical protein